MSNTIVASVYSGVIKDVIEKVRKDFVDSGVGEQVLDELERIWEHKIKSAKVATWESNGMMPGIPILPEDQNINGGSNSVYSQPPPSDPNLKYQASRGEYEAQAVSLLPSIVAAGIPPNHSSEVGKPQGYIIKNGNGLPQQVPQAPPPSDIPNRSSPATLINSQADANANLIDQKIFHNNQMMGGQQDIEFGNPLSEKLIPRPVPSEDNSPLPEFNTPMEPSYDNDDINSDLDDPDDEDNNPEGEDTQNIILCLYDKVTRTKNKWKCQLKDGIMSVNGRDYLFQKGNGDFEF